MAKRARAVRAFINQKDLVYGTDVDVRMQPQQFTATALGSFEEALRKAPQFS